jgi:hypothetical protein
VFSFLKQIRSENLGSKPLLILIASISVFRKTCAANFGLNDIPGLCVNSVNRLNSTEHFPCQSISLPANAQSSAFRLYYEVNFYNILNLII